MSVKKLNYSVEEVNELLKHIENINFVTPEMFGGMGDGVTDDTNAIQDAIDYANENDKIVQFLGKTYVTGQIQLYKGTQLKGQGVRNTTIYLKDGLDVPFINIDEDADNINITNLTIGDFTINGNKFNNTCPVIFRFNQDGDTHHTIYNIEMTIPYNHGIYMKRGENRLSNLYIHHAGGYGIYHIGSDNFFDNISCAWCYECGIGEFGSSDKWVNCKAFVNGEYYGPDNLPNKQSPGFQIQSGARSVFVNCESQENYGHGWYIDTHPLLQLVNCTGDQNGMINKNNDDKQFMAGFAFGTISHVNLIGACTNFRGSDNDNAWQRCGLLMLNANCSDLNINLKCTNQIVNYNKTDTEIYNSLLTSENNNIITINNKNINTSTITTTATDLETAINLTNELKKALTDLGLIN